MAKYDNSGILFRNDRATSDKAPSHKGSITVAGVEYDLAAWVKEARNGSKFFSLKVSPKGERDNQQTGRREEPAVDDDHPF